MEGSVCTSWSAEVFYLVFHKVPTDMHKLIMHKLIGVIISSVLSESCDATLVVSVSSTIMQCKYVYLPGQSPIMDLLLG